MNSKRAELIIANKLTLNSDLVQEIRIWKSRVSEKYPEGFRYRLVLANPRSGKVLLLYDNHWPKGHHIHSGNAEFPYRFVSLERLLKDFFRQVQKIERHEK
jgi:Family of unknown function (DUF6516)